MLAAAPVLLLTGDSYYYLQDARSLSPSAWHPLGYPLFVRALSWTGDLRSVVAAQHVLGLALAGVVYAVLLRLRLRPWLAAVGVLPLLLDAYQVDIEQGILAETLEEVLLTGGLLLLVRRRQPGIAGCLLAGLLLAAASLTRGYAFAVPVLIALVIFLLIQRWGWVRSLAVLAALLAPVIGYAAWYDQVNHQFAIEGLAGRILYGRVESLAYDHCRQLHIPPEERLLCDPRLPADPIGGVPAEEGANFYAWSTRSPYARLEARHRGRADTIAQAYDDRVIAAEPLPYLWSTIVGTAAYFAPDRTEVAAGQWPVQAWQFRARTGPARFHVLLGTASFGQVPPHRLPSPQREHWPAVLLADYQTVGFTPGPVLLAALLLTGVAFAIRRPGPVARQQRVAALLLGLTGLLVLVVAAAAAGNEPRYLLPTLPLIPPAGASAVESLAGTVRSRRGSSPAATTPADREAQPGGWSTRGAAGGRVP
jgi:hypothetical protein